MRLATLSLVLVGLFAQTSRATMADFIVTINREHSGPDCTSGYLEVDGRVQANALERPRENSTPLISSIPAGNYAGVLRYDGSDQWTIELRGVPGREHVQLRMGNTPEDSEGDILIGKDLAPGRCQIKAGTGEQAYADLKRAFYGTDRPASTPDGEIIVTIKDVARIK
jgi:hypothetical protein